MVETIAFEDLPTADLVIDSIYRSGRAGNVGDDPIAQLLPCGNQGGIRFKKRGNSYLLAVLYTTGLDPDWPDALDPETGLFTYFGDNKTPGKLLHGTSRRGNILLRDGFAAVHSTPPDYRSAPPFFVFAKAGSGRDVRFLGVAVPGAEGLTARDDLVAIWRSTRGARFQNYRAIFTVLDAPVVRREWIDDLANGGSGSQRPPAWTSWIEHGVIQPLVAPATLTIRSREQQLPSTRGGAAILEAVRAHFAGRPHDFEECAVKLWRMLDRNVGAVEMTPPSRDGGRDAVGSYQVGPASDRIDLDFALEAKCYAPTNSVGIRELARLISRLRYRQFGVLVTTSYVHKQAYEEIRNDEHPVVIICGADIVSILRDHGLASVSDVRAWLGANFSD